MTIIEGLFSLSNAALLEQLDLKVFVDADGDVRLSRRITRDITEHNRSLEFILHQYFSYVKPMHNLYVEPQKEIADFIISGNAKNDNLIALVCNALEER